ncbi:tRNA (adenine(22)-N(1))-methyltransferase TrmK, partial [Thermovenabulum sp.]
ILQPMKNLCELRRFLLENRFVFKDELVIKEGKRFYEIWVVTKSKDMEFSFDDVDILIGPILKNKREEIVKEYLKDRIDRLQENYRFSAKGKDKVKQEEILKKLKILTEVLKDAFLCHDY